MSLHYRRPICWTIGSCVVLFLLSVWGSSCKKKQILTDGGEIRFSVDTLLFDTVFTAQGSATRHIKIFNPQDADLHISSIRLAQGQQSAYRLNINGYAGTEVKDIELAGHDSLWVFAAVTIDPTDEDAPFVVEDQLVVTLNGREFAIPVIAFGQNAIYIVDSVLDTQTWSSEKPYIIIKNALVDQDATLTIQAGTRVYMHQDSRLYVQGSLKIQGNLGDSVIFQGDRIDRDIYVGSDDDVPGEWGGLYFFPGSHDNEIDYAVFKNGGAVTDFFGSQVIGAMIQVNQDSVAGINPVLKITNSVIHHSLGYGILAFNSSIYAENCLIAECGAENVMIFEGGRYQFYDCTLATFGGPFLSHSKSATMIALNYLPISDEEYTGKPLSVDVKNTMIYGSLENELYVARKPEFAADVSFRNCLIKTSEGLPSFVTAADNIFNQSPQFADRSKMDYHVTAGSPAIGNGITAGTLATDLDGKQRSSSPTIGCYEF